MHSLAEFAAGLGLPVFPCAADKRPIVEGGFKAASSDPSVIRSMFASPSAKMVGMPTGRASGLVAIDIDVKAGAKGDVWLQANADRLPTTRTHKTQSGGLHLVFEMPAGVEIRNSASRIAPGVDVRASGGYVILPGSPGYSVADPAAPAQMPDWLIQACTKPESPRVATPLGPRAVLNNSDGTPWGIGSLRRACEAIRNAADGAKHDTLNREAYGIGGLVAGGELIEGAAIAALSDALAGLRHRCEDYPAAERTLKQAFRDGMASPRQAPPPREVRHTIRIEMAPPEMIPWDDAPEYLSGEPSDQPPTLDYDPETGEVYQGAQPLKEPPPKPRGFDVLDPRDWTGPSKPREWIVPDWIPRGVVTAIYGDGGMGKSLLAQHLLTSVSLGGEWLGLPVAKGRALGIMCEDDPDELHRRQEAINKGMGCGPSDLADLRYVSRVGFDNILMAFDGKDVGQLTQVFDDMDAACEAFRPDLLVCDTIADFFGGNENNRAQVRQFVQNSFGRLARKYGCGLLIAGHPSVSGITSGNGTGGSTAWNNTVRSRMYLTKPEGEDANPDARLLSRKKANYAPKDAELSIVWKAGCFQVADASQAQNLPDWAIISGILDMIETGWRAGTPWSNARQTRESGRYLPAAACKRFDLSETMAAKLVSDWLVEGHITVQMADAKAKTKGLKVVRRFDREG